MVACLVTKLSVITCCVMPEGASGLNQQCFAEVAPAVELKTCIYLFSIVQ